MGQEEKRSTKGVSYSIFPHIFRYTGDMSEAQQKCLNEFKDWIEKNNITQNPWHKDYFFLKFCRARKFDLPKVKEMFTNYMKYRTENDLDNILTVSIIF